MSNKFQCGFRSALVAAIVLLAISGCTRADKAERPMGASSGASTPKEQAATSDAGVVAADEIKVIAKSVSAPTTLLTLCDLLSAKSLEPLGVFARASVVVDSEGMPERMTCNLRSPNYDSDFGNPSDAKALDRVAWSNFSITASRREGKDAAETLLRDQIAAEEEAGVESDPVSLPAIEGAFDILAQWTPEARMMRASHQKWVVFVGVSHSLEPQLDQEIASALLPKVIAALDRN